MKVLLHLIAILFATVALVGCISDDFTSSPNDTLEFSTDVVSFDTVFTDLGTPTARLKVFNRAKKSVNISRIAFKNPSSNFTLNVDGVSGTTFRDVEIRGNDSIFIFIECFIDEDNSREPFLISDELQFLTNGVEQSVEVQAWGQNVTRLQALTLTSDMTLRPELPYVVFDSLVVAPDATLTIEPGVQLMFHDKAELIVHGKIDARGTPEKFIDFRGDRLDYVIPGTKYDILAGQWKGMRITPESFDNHMEYVNMRSTSEGLILEESKVYDRTKLTLVNSWLHNSQASVFTANYCKTQSYGVCFSEAADAVVALEGGDHDMSQCTFANSYLFAVPFEAILHLSYLFPDEMPADEEGEPLMRANIDNSIFYGIAADINPGDLMNSEVFLRYCSLNAAGSDDDNFINCFWDTNPLFLTVREEYIFNYHLQPDSPVIGVGDPALVNPLTITDMDGVNRLADGNPTLGAYAKLNN